MKVTAFFPQRFYITLHITTTYPPSIRITWIPLEIDDAFLYIHYTHIENVNICTYRHSMLLLRVSYDIRQFYSQAGYNSKI